MVKYVNLHAVWCYINMLIYMLALYKSTTSSSKCMESEYSNGSKFRMEKVKTAHKYTTND